MACAKFIKEHCPTGRLHIFGMDKPKHGATQKFINSLLKADVLGKWCGLYPDMASVFRAADFVVTPHIIATRIVREARACGCPVIQTFGELDINQNVKRIIADWEIFRTSPNIRNQVRVSATLMYNLEKSGQQMKKIFEEVMKHKPPMGCRKINGGVFLDIGGHVGETVRKFYSDVAYANEWDIVTFEPNPDCMEKMKQGLTRYDNVKYDSRALADYTSKAILQIGEVNEADGSTLIDGKLTGKLTGKKEVDVIDFSEWFETNKIGDYKKVIVKMNVEGAEYPILYSITRSGILKDIDVMLVNTHSCKFREPEKSQFEQREKEFLEYSKGFNCKVVFKKQGEFDYSDYI
jgi:FkbM family methyltransferase